MAIEKKNEGPQTLEAGLDFWSRQEQKFQSLFGKESLKDKEFLKMKLRHYDNLWYQYKTAPLGIEGQLMRNMLKFQRRKIDKSLHRGLLRSIIRKINIAIKSNRAQNMQRKIENRNRLELYTESSPKPKIQEKPWETIIQPGREEQIKNTSEATVNAESHPKITKQKRTNSYSYHRTPWHKYKKRKSSGIHH
jgi:hypothetical protein